MNMYLYNVHLSMQSHHNFVHQIHRALPIGWGVSLINFFFFDLNLLKKQRYFF